MYLQEMSLNEGQFEIRWIYFPSFITFHICFAFKQRTTLQWITKGPFSSSPSLLQSARPTTTSAAYRHVYGWEVALHTAGTGRNRTQWNKKTLCHLHCWHFPHRRERARASGVHLSPCAGFDVVALSCRHVVCVQDLVWATWHVLNAVGISCYRVCAEFHFLFSAALIVFPQLRFDYMRNEVLVNKTFAWSCCSLTLHPYITLYLKDYFIL